MYQNPGSAIARCLVFSLAVLSSLPLRASSEVKTSKSFEYGPFVFHVEPGVRLKKFYRSISLRRIPGIDFFEKDSNSSVLETRLGWKFSAIFRRVQSLMNMYPRRLDKVHVRIYPDFREVWNKLKFHSHRNAPAVYVVREKTIYISARKCDEYILAHEMAHAVIAHYFVVQPPVNAQEILAMYCDKHLKDQSV
jgi:hypothetical protein